MTFQKASRIQRKGAKEILRVGQKALAYRKDLLDKEQRDRLKHANEKLLGGNAGKTGAFGALGGIGQ